jgi:glycine cleavage system regulatory protein
MKSIVLSVLGDDKPGLIDALSSVVVSHNGDWVESKMSKIEGKFAGILRIDAPDDNMDALVNDLAASNLGLSIACEELRPPVQPSRFKNYNIELIGNNHPGIIKQLSHVLANLGANLEEMRTEVVDGTMSGERLFKAQINLQLPVGVNEDFVRGKLEQIANEMMVEIYSYED